MLDHMGFNQEAEKIRNSVQKVMKEGKFLTRDLGGKSSTSEYVKALTDNLE